jgi:phosphatidylglycerol lysyltransferase
MEDLTQEQEQEQQQFDQVHPSKKTGKNLSPGGREFLSIASALLRQSWPVWLVSLVTFLSGVWSIVSILLTRVQRHGQYLLPFDEFHLTRTLTLVLGFILVYLSFHLLQRRRTAWWVAIFATALAIAAHLMHLRTWYTALPQTAIFALLIVFQRRFSVRSESRNIGMGFLLLVTSLFIALLYGTIGFWMLDKRDFGMTFSLQTGLIRSLRQFLLIGNSDLVPITRQAHWFLQSLDILGIVAAAFAMYSLFRPIVYRFVERPHEQARAMAILKKYGHSTFDYFKVWQDKSYFFSPSLESFISYLTVGDVAFCLADPVGPDTDRDATIRAFLSFCVENGWQAVVMMPDDPPIYDKHGLSLLKVGEEAIVDLDHFTSKTYGAKYFRYVRRKFEGEGYKMLQIKPPISPSVLVEVENISRKWLTLPHHREYGFLQGRFDQAYLEKSTLHVLRDANGTMVAFINEVPSYRPGEANFDMMRHIPGLHWGTMDYLFAQMMVTMKNEGYRTFNFGVAPFVGIGDRPNATLTEKAVNQLFERLDWFVHSKGLKQYKLKFEPVWKDSFIAYQGGPVGLLRAALNISRIL